MMDDNRYEVVPYQGPPHSTSQDVVMVNGVPYSRVGGMPVPLRRGIAWPRDPWIALLGGTVAVAVVGTGVWCLILGLLAVVHAVEAHALEVGIVAVVVFMSLLVLLVTWTKFRVAGARRYY